MSLVNVINELVVENVEKSSEFYEDNFKFETEFTEGDPITWTQLKKDDVRIMLEEYNTVKSQIANYPSKVNTSNLIKFEYSKLEEIQQIYKILKQKDIEFFMDYTETDYGKVEFGVFDPDKNMILISAYMVK